MNRLFIYGFVLMVGGVISGCQQQANAPVQEAPPPLVQSNVEAVPAESEKDSKNLAQEFVEKSKQSNQAVEELGK